MSFFKYEEVLVLDKIQEKEVEKVWYHYWVNIAKEEEVRVLDTLQLIFKDGSALSVSARTDECLKLVDLDVDKDRQELLEQFQGKIVLQSQEASDIPLWEDASLLSHISLRKSDEGQYLNDAILLAFANKEIVVFYDGDSIGVEEVFEEIDE